MLRTISNTVTFPAVMSVYGVGKSPPIQAQNAWAKCNQASGVWVANGGRTLRFTPDLHLENERLNQNKINSTLTATLGFGHKADNCKICIHIRRVRTKDPRIPVFSSDAAQATCEARPTKIDVYIFARFSSQPNCSTSAKALGCFHFRTHLNPFTPKFKKCSFLTLHGEMCEWRNDSLVVRPFFVWVSYEKPSSSCCVMKYYCWGCRRNFNLITLGKYEHQRVGVHISEIGPCILSSHPEKILWSRRIWMVPAQILFNTGFITTPHPTPPIPHVGARAKNSARNDRLVNMWSISQHRAFRSSRGRMKLFAFLMRRKDQLTFQVVTACPHYSQTR